MGSGTCRKGQPTDFSCSVLPDDCPVRPLRADTDHHPVPVPQLRGCHDCHVETPPEPTAEVSLENSSRRPLKPSKRNEDWDEDLGGSIRLFEASGEGGGGGGGGESALERFWAGICGADVQGTNATNLLQSPKSLSALSPKPRRAPGGLGGVFEFPAQVNPPLDVRAEVLPKANRLLCSSVVAQRRSSRCSRRVESRRPLQPHTSRGKLHVNFESSRLVIQCDGPKPHTPNRSSGGALPKTLDPKHGWSRSQILGPA